MEDNAWQYNRKEGLKATGTGKVIEGLLCPCILYGETEHLLQASRARETRPAGQQELENEETDYHLFNGNCFGFVIKSIIKPWFGGGQLARRQAEEISTVFGLDPHEKDGTKAGFFPQLTVIRNLAEANNRENIRLQVLDTARIVAEYRQGPVADKYESHAPMAVPGGQHELYADHPIGVPDDMAERAHAFIKASSAPDATPEDILKHAHALIKSSSSVVSPEELVKRAHIFFQATAPDAAPEEITKRAQSLLKSSGPVTTPEEIAKRTHAFFKHAAPNAKPDEIAKRAQEFLKSSKGQDPFSMLISTDPSHLGSALITLPEDVANRALDFLESSQDKNPLAKVMSGEPLEGVAHGAISDDLAKKIQSFLEADEGQNTYSTLSNFTAGIPSQGGPAIPDDLAKHIQSFLESKTGQDTYSTLSNFMSNAASQLGKQDTAEQAQEFFEANKGQNPLSMFMGDPSQLGSRPDSTMMEIPHGFGNSRATTPVPASQHGRRSIVEIPQGFGNSRATTPVAKTRGPHSLEANHVTQPRSGKPSSHAHSLASDPMIAPRAPVTAHSLSADSIVATKASRPAHSLEEDPMNQLLPMSSRAHDLGADTTVAWIKAATAAHDLATDSTVAAMKASRPAHTLETYHVNQALPAARSAHDLAGDYTVTKKAAAPAHGRGSDSVIIPKIAVPSHDLAADSVILPKLAAPAHDLLADHN